MCKSTGSSIRAQAQDCDNLRALALDRKLADQAKREISRWGNIEAANRTVEYVQACCTRLHNEPEPNSDRAAAIASAAEAALAQLWGIPEMDLQSRL
jgi:hypothetical protein